MFTGIVEEMGTVRQISQSDDSVSLAISCKRVLEGTRTGDSIAVNGVCLTVTQLDADSFHTGLAPETLKRSNLGALVSGSAVNLERSLCPTSRMGGHFVQGHVDCRGEISGFEQERDALWVTVKVPRDIMRYIVSKGYITLDGTSLTVVDTGEDWFNVTLVAYTRQHIILPLKNIGDQINVEVDVLGKYVERQLQHMQQKP